MNRIRELRKESGMTIGQLAKKCNIGRSSISQYESGKRSPSTKTQLALADIFNVDVDYLMGRSSIKERLDLDDLNNNKIEYNEGVLINAYRKAASPIQKAIRIMLGIEEN